MEAVMPRAPDIRQQRLQFSGKCEGTLPVSNEPLERQQADLLRPGVVTYDPEHLRREACKLLTLAQDAQNESRPILLGRTSVGACKHLPDLRLCLGSDQRREGVDVHRCAGQDLRLSEKGCKQFLFLIGGKSPGCLRRSPPRQHRC